MIEHELLTKTLSLALMCVGLGWLVRANIFGILGDVPRLLLPVMLALFTMDGFSLTGSLFVVLAIWGGICVLFFLARENLGGDDILLSLGLQATVFGFASWIAAAFLHEKQFNLQDKLASYWLMSVIVMSSLLLISVYLLTLSNLRVQLAHAAQTARASSVYPYGTKRPRMIAVIAAACCLAAAALGPLVTNYSSLGQITDGTGILLFGVAYALRGRAIACAAAGAAIAMVGWYTVRVQAYMAVPLTTANDSGLIVAILNVAPLLVGFLIIVVAFRITYRRA